MRACVRSLHVARKLRPGKPVSAERGPGSYGRLYTTCAWVWINMFNCAIVQVVWWAGSHDEMMQTNTRLCRCLQAECNRVAKMVAVSQHVIFHYFVLLKCVRVRVCVSVCVFAIVHQSITWWYLLGSRWWESAASWCPHNPAQQGG